MQCRESPGRRAVRQKESRRHPICTAEEPPPNNPQWAFFSVLFLLYHIQIECVPGHYFPAVSHARADLAIP